MTRCASFVQLEIGVTEHSRPLPATGPAREQPTAGDELLDTERLGQVVIAAYRQPANPIGRRSSRGEKDDGSGNGSPSQSLTYREAVRVGKHDVEDDHVWHEFRYRGKGFLTGLADLDGLPIHRQRRANQVADVRLVVDHQRASHAVTHPAQSLVEYRCTKSTWKFAQTHGQVGRSRLRLETGERRTELALERGLLRGSQRRRRSRAYVVGWKSAINPGGDARGASDGRAWG